MRSPRRILVPLAALAGSLALLGACSSGGSASEPTTTAVVTTATPATTAATAAAPATTRAGALGLDAELIRQFLTQFGGVKPSDAELACVTGKLPAGALDTVISEATKAGGNLQTAVGPIVKAVAECKPASLVDVVGRQLRQADPGLSLTGDQSSCIVGGLLDVVAANPSLVNVVLGATRIGGLPTDVRTTLTTALGPKVRSCVPADTATRVLAAVDRL